MGADLILILVAGVAQLVMGVMGIWWAFRPPRPERHWLAAGTFGLVGAIGLGAVVWAGIRGTESSTHVEGGIIRIEKTGDTNGSMLKALQNKFDAQSGQLSAVQQENASLAAQNGRLLAQNDELDADIKKIAGAANLSSKPTQSPQGLSDQIIRYLATIDQRLHSVEYPPRDNDALYDGARVAAHVAMQTQQAANGVIQIQALTATTPFDFSKQYFLQAFIVKCDPVTSTGEASLGGETHIEYWNVTCHVIGKAPT